MRRLTAILAAILAAFFISAPVPAHATTGTWVWSRPIPHYYQDTAWNCMPASATNQLASAGGTVDSTTQDMLAGQFGTVESDPGGGTDWKNAVGPLDSIVAPNYTYDVRYTHSGVDVMTEVRYQIDNLQDGVMAPTVWNALPWNSGSTSTAGHVILIYGYNVTQDAFYTWDPWPNHGYEWITATDLYNALAADRVLIELERKQ